MTSRTPAPGATGVAVSTNVRAVFDRALDPATVTTQTVQLSAGSSNVAAQVAYDAPSRTITLTPSAALAPATTYTARLTTGVKGQDGTPLGSEVTWTFTTQAGLSVTARTPAPLATGVSPLADVTRDVQRRPRRLDREHGLGDADRPERRGRGRGDLRRLFAHDHAQPDGVARDVDELHGARSRLRSAAAVARR